jgi:hypothetical protein
MASDRSRYFQNAVTKTQTAALGFRVKSGWAAVVLLTGTARAPKLAHIGRIELCDPQNPETRQPYHAAMGKLETNSIRLNHREGVVRNIARQSLTELFNDYQKKGFRIKRAARLCSEAGLIRQQLRTFIFERMPSKDVYFGRPSSNLRWIARFVLNFCSNATLMPA